MASGTQKPDGVAILDFRGQFCALAQVEDSSLRETARRARATIEWE